jgi:hypothetical protein
VNADQQEFDKAKCLVGSVRMTVGRSPAGLWSCHVESAIKVYPVAGADIVMESMSLTNGGGTWSNQSLSNIVKTERILRSPFLMCSFRA